LTTLADLTSSPGQTGTITDKIPASCRTPTGGTSGSEGTNPQPAIKETVAKGPKAKAVPLRQAEPFHPGKRMDRCRLVVMLVMVRILSADGVAQYFRQARSVGLDIRICRWWRVRSRR